MTTLAAPRVKNRTKQFIRGEFEVKAKDDGKRTFSGVLSTSHIDNGDWQYRDIVWPGAFKRTLDHFHGTGSRAGEIPLTDSHNYGSIFNVLGHMLDGREVLTGETLEYELKAGGVLEVPEMRLETEWQVVDGADGERLLDRLRPGSVRRMSMGYESILEDYTELKAYGSTRNLREVALREGALVVFAMNDFSETDPASVKSLFEAFADGTLTAQQKAAFRALLDAGPSPPDEGSPPDDTQPNEPAQTEDMLEEHRKAALSLRIRLLTLKGSATRNGPARHAVSV